MREGGRGGLEREGRKGTLALHCFKKRHICHHSDSFALLGLRREEGGRRRMRLGDPIFWQFFLISSKGKRGGGAFRSTCVRAVRVPEEPAFMAAAYVSALRRHRPSRSRNMFLFATLRRAPLGLTSGPFFATEKMPSPTKGACPSCQECLPQILSKAFFIGQNL